MYDKGSYGGLATDHAIGDGAINKNIRGSRGINTVPTFASVKDEQGDITVQHREYVGDIFANKAGEYFENKAFDLNPGLQRTFPWLSQLAMNFDEYVFIQLAFTFRSTISIATSSGDGQTGMVILCTDYNPDHPKFDSKQRMMEYDGAQSAKCTISAVHGVECDPSKLAGDQAKRMRTAPVLVHGNKLDYDLGKFQIAISGTPAALQNNTIGEIWVSYTVLLRKPKYYQALGLGIPRSIYTCGTGQTALDCFGNEYNDIAGYPLKGQQNSIDAIVRCLQPPASQAAYAGTTITDPYYCGLPASGGEDQKWSWRKSYNSFTSAIGTQWLEGVDPVTSLNPGTVLGGLYVSTSALVASFLITMPGDAEGLYEVELMTKNPSTLTTHSLHLSTSGNIVPVCDIINGGPSSSTTPAATAIKDPSWIKADCLKLVAGDPQIKPASNTNDSGDTCIKMHFNVHIATFGMFNSINFEIPVLMNATTTRQPLTSIVIKRYNGHDDTEPAVMINHVGTVSTFW